MTQAKKRRIPRKRRRAVEQDLLDQLERNGTYGAYYVDLVTDYMLSLIHIYGCRIGNEVRENPQAGFIRRGRTDEEVFFGVDQCKPKGTVQTFGRFPANCVTTEPGAFFSKYFNVTPPELSKKASKKDRNSDWRGEEITLPERILEKEEPLRHAENRTTSARNTHPTVKPTDLMAWLVRLVTPPGGIVLDPFAGSG